MLHVIPVRWEACLEPGRIVEGPAERLGAVNRRLLMEGCRGIDPSHSAQVLEPIHTDGDVRRLFLGDLRDDGGAARVARPLELVDEPGSGVEPAGLLHHGDGDEPREKIVAGGVGGAPQEIVRIERAVARTELPLQPLETPKEVARLVRRDARKVLEERERKRGVRIRGAAVREAAHGIPRQVDRVQFDVCHYV